MSLRPPKSGLNMSLFGDDASDASDESDDDNTSLRYQRVKAPAKQLCRRMSRCA